MINETNIAALIATHAKGIEYQEKYAVGWISGDAPDKASERLMTIARNHPDATIVVFGDETIGIEIEGRLWAAQKPHPERGLGQQIQLPRGDWQWLNWASDHKIEDGLGGWINFGDTADLRIA